MESREDLRKKNNRNNLYLLIGGIVLIIAIIAGFAIHSHNVATHQKAAQFARNHFNPKVKIDGVKVGKLTITKATSKVNRRAKNNVNLKQGKIIYTRNPAETTITKKEVSSFFKRQHTTVPNNQTYNYQSPDLRKAEKKLRHIDKMVVSFQVAGHDFKLKGHDMITDASYKNNRYQINDHQPIAKKIKDINHQVATLHQSYQFAVPVGDKVKGKVITVKNKTYGWGVYDKRAIRAIENAFLKDEKTINGANYLYGEGYSTYPHGYMLSDHGIGKTYVVVSLGKQEIWQVEKGKITNRLTDVVTGTMEGSKGDQTPRGVWYIHYKERGATLRGQNDDGSNYASPVSYWMPFTLSGCGFHDASWRTDWSKTAYLKGGSHGCINIRPAEIRSVWKHMHKNEPVIVYE